MRYLFLLVIFIFSACDKSCPSNYFENITHFKVNSNTITKSGFKVDTIGYNVDLDSLDERLLKIEKCLQDVYEFYPSITTQESIDWQCIRKTFSSKEKLNRSCLIIKVVEPIFSQCSIYQFIKECEDCGPAYVNPQYCIEKGIIPTEECKCIWRTGIQDNWTIITPPAIYLWDVIRASTTCNNIWLSPFNICANY